MSSAAIMSYCYAATSWATCFYLRAQVGNHDFSTVELLEKENQDFCEQLNDHWLFLHRLRCKSPRNWSNNQISKQIWAENGTRKNKNTNNPSQVCCTADRWSPAKGKEHKEKRQTLFLPVSGGQRGPPTTRPNQSSNKSIYHSVSVQIKHLTMQITLNCACRRSLAAVSNVSGPASTSPS